MLSILSFPAFGLVEVVVPPFSHRLGLEEVPRVREFGQRDIGEIVCGLEF
jgi:hypothetical protein